MNELHWKLETGLPDPVEVGLGGVRMVRGYCFHRRHAVRRLALVLGDEEHVLRWIREPRPDVFAAHAGLDDTGRSRCAGFWGLVPLQPELAGKRLRIRLRVWLGNGAVEERSLGDVRFVQGLRASGAPVRASGARVAVCMATYDPDIDAFARQIQSIREQSVTDWICIVNDDCSPPETFRHMQSVVAGEPRIHLYRNERNVGFYGNFEICLKRVPAGVPFVALSDQDDMWYPEKLERLLAAMDERTTLVYSDMRIVDADGKVLSSTYWSRRRNNYTDLGVLLVANTITGAASLFRTELLERILPFPQRIGHGFHDHWVAAVAMAVGRIRYIDAPLYDYVQYGSNVIGHCDFAPVTLQRRLKALARWAGIVSRALWKRIRGRGEPGKFKADLLHLRDRLVAIYCAEYRRIQLISELLRIRCPRLPRRHAAATALCSGTWRTVPALVALHARVSRRGHTTNNAELRLLAAYLGYTVDKALMSLLRPLLVQRTRRLRIADAENNRRRIEFLKSKIAPLRIEVAESEPRRVNIVVPQIRFDTLFGGYIAKLHFARRLAQRGHKVRMILVDACDAAALGEAPPGVEVLCRRHRDLPVRMNPRDVVVATTWWTAHIAAAAAAELGTKRFLYLIQEYEPFTFPLGTYYALAEQSYALPHYALFSTALLEEYFRNHRLGVYADAVPAAMRRARFFSNAILRFSDARPETSGRPLGLLFYARSDEHAARNLFEIGYLALEKALAEGVFEKGRWQFTAVGTTYGDLELPGGRRLRMVGKVDLDTYRRMLLEHDVGLSLIYTPHPSLVPLEMAAAGMLVVTNTFANKSRERLESISSNIIAVKPHIEAVARGLARAAAGVEDLRARAQGACFEWPHTWEEALPDALLDEIMGWFDAQTAAAGWSGG